MDNPGESTPLVESRIPRSTKMAYSLGHIFNDLAAVMWFSYTLLYLQRIALFEPVTAGAMLLLGQIVDALMTPVFGILVDKYGSKKKWHIAGSGLVVISFPLIFGTSLELTSPGAMFIYISSIAVFQTGWAAVQISHLSMIPALSSSPLARADLTAIRYSAQISAAIVVFAVTWMILPNGGDSMTQVTLEDGYKFRDIVMICTAIGVTTTVFFHVFLKAKHLEDRSSTGNNSDGTTIQKSSDRRNNWSDTSLLLRVALLYVASRLFTTLATVYLPLYIEETGIGGKQALATVPLSKDLASFIAAFGIKYINKSCGTKMCYLLGILIGILSCLVVEFAGSTLPVMYTAALLIGTGSSITTVTSLSLTAELIGPRTERSALVYSVVTFLDKVGTGLVVMIIEEMRCVDKNLCPNYSKDTLSTVCSSSMLLGLLALASVARCLT